jgi:hypothetical protein
MSSTRAPCVEQFTVTGQELLTRIKQLVDVGNVRRVVIRTERRRTLIEIPLPLGTRSDALEPVWAAVSSLGRCMPSCTVVVEREVAWPTAGAVRAEGVGPTATV